MCLINVLANLRQNKKTQIENLEGLVIRRAKNRNYQIPNGTVGNLWPINAIVMATV